MRLAYEIKCVGIAEVSRTPGTALDVHASAACRKMPADLVHCSMRARWHTLYRIDAAIVTTGLQRTWHYVDLQLAIVVNFAVKQLQ